MLKTFTIDSYVGQTVKLIGLAAGVQVPTQELTLQGYDDNYVFLTPVNAGNTAQPWIFPREAIGFQVVGAARAA